MSVHITTDMSMSICMRFDIIDAIWKRYRTSSSLVTAWMIRPPRERCVLYLLFIFYDSLPCAQVWLSYRGPADARERGQVTSHGQPAWT